MFLSREFTNYAKAGWGYEYRCKSWLLSNYTKKTKQMTLSHLLCIV